MMENKLVAKVNVEDERLNFEFTNPNWKTLKTQRAHDDAMLDFNVPRDEEASKKGHTQDLPLSFFQIGEGDVEAGKHWYLGRFPKLGDDLAELMARYNWGDLKYATKKSLRNDRKRHVKRKGTKPKITLEKEERDTIIVF